jgi:hypothetical protein
MLTYFTVSSVLPQVNGSTIGMGLALARAAESPRAAERGGLPDDVAALAAQNCIPSSIWPGRPVAGAALLDLLV